MLNDTPANVPGSQFINTAKWDFGRLIDGVFYEPLPGEWGVTPPMTIAAPVLVATKSGPATMNLGQWGNFAIDVQNTGLSDAWNATIRDLLPDGATGGMCDLTPEILSVQVFAADGVTPVPGKGPLSPGKRLLAELQRCTQLPARHHDADGRGNDRPERAADHPLPDTARRQHAERRRAHQRRRRHPVVQRRQQQSRRVSLTRAR